MPSGEQLEIRYIIKFCQKQGDTPTDTYKKMMSVPGKYPVSRALVFKWYKRFKNGLEEMEDREGRGRKRKISATLTTSISDALEKDRRLTVRTLSERFDVSIGTVHTILRNNLRMRKVHARWVPRLLKEHEKVRRVDESKAFLRRARLEGDDFLGRIITTDETWLWFYDPETKVQSAMWTRNGSPPPKKARVSKCGGKYMFIMFADSDGMILQHAVPKNCTVNADYYCKVLRRDLIHALEKKRPGIPTEQFILHMDNASSHTAQITQLELAVLGFRTITHPPYSPDLAPFDFAIFPSIKSQLKGQRFETLNDLRVELQRITRQYDAAWYKDIFTRQWIHRHQRCVELGGEYFEKGV